MKRYQDEGVGHVLGDVRSLDSRVKAHNRKERSAVGKKGKKRDVSDSESSVSLPAPVKKRRSLRQETLRSVAATAASGPTDQSTSVPTRGGADFYIAPPPPPRPTPVDSRGYELGTAPIQDRPFHVPIGVPTSSEMISQFPLLNLPPASFEDERLMARLGVSIMRVLADYYAPNESPAPAAPGPSR